MLTCPESPSLCIFLIISLNICADIGDRTDVDSLLNKFLAANSRSLVHALNHLVSSLHVVNPAHPRSHDMHRTKDNVTLLLACLEAGEGFLDAVDLNIALVGEDIPRAPVLLISPNYL